MHISPSLYSAGLEGFDRAVSIVEESGCDSIHVDVMDGHFVPRLDFGPSVVRAVRSMTHTEVDVHLMVAHPEAVIEEIAQVGADVITVHHEATDHIYRCLQLVRKLGKRAGVALNPGTSAAVIAPYAHLLDRVLVMTCNPGVAGESFIPEMLDKVSEVRGLRDARGLGFDIEVDGGVNAQSVERCRDAGADVAVCGGFIFNAESPADSIKQLLEGGAR